MKSRSASNSTPINLNDVRSITSPEYGAVGDDSTDNTAAINAALAEAGEDGGATVFIPKGSFRHTGLLINHDNVQLQGAGRSIATLRNTDPTSNGITISDPESGGASGASDWRQDVAIRDLGLKPVGTRTAGFEVFAPHTMRLDLTRLYLENVFGGFSLGKPSSNNSAWANVHDIFANNWKNLIYLVNIIDSNFSHWTTYQSLHLDDIAILMDGGCEGNQFNFIGPVNATPGANTSHSAPNLRIQTGAYTERVAGLNKFNHMYFDTHNTGIELLNCLGTTFANCYISARPGRGVFIGGGAEAISILGNTIVGSGTDGIYIDGGKDHIISNNTIINANHGGGNNGGIYLNSGASNVQICNNAVVKDGSFRVSAADHFGIGIHPDANNYLIKDNTLRGMTDKIIKWDKAAGAKTAVSLEDTATRILKDNLFSVTA